jgi:hypothetical protein
MCFAKKNAATWRPLFVRLDDAINGRCLRYIGWELGKFMLGARSISPRRRLSRYGGPDIF